ncbi:aldose epimerase [Corynebacterium pelargi]|uniref:Aldose 1-epimerase n=1 Tax=Corynebacterium pelargi TaxID=1471400 RepID=A0A410W9K7_9CORY|nr:aldose epimerase [Corynebacterium pelargi]QAU52629.1 Aldose 1-epimerase [Corynebacterium pelargi]GGG77759.1 aldose 1-epimerase [Corynebacterium pelargi]
MGKCEPHVVHLKCGDMAAEINTLGAGLKSLTYNGDPLVETYTSPNEPPLAAGLWLAPWPNRTEDGTFEFEGQEHQLDITEPERNNAIHGFVHKQVWDVVQHYENVASLSCEIAPTQGWPWPITLSVNYQLSPFELTATVIAQTEAPEAPFALGWHTYLSAKGAETDRSTLRVNVEKQLPLDANRNLPCGDLQESDLAKKLRQGTSLQGVVMDDCFRVDRGLVAELTSDDGGVRMVCEDAFHWAQIFTPDESFGVTYPGRGRAVAVEPMTAPPNALKSATDLATLKHPGLFCSTVKLQVMHQRLN